MSSIDDTGFVKSTLSDLQRQLQQGIAGIMGQDTDVDPESQDGQVCGVLCEPLSELTDLAESTYNGLTPAGATGAMQSRLVGLHGLTRDEGEYSTFVIPLAGTKSTVVLAGSIVKVTSQATIWQMALDATVTLDANGAGLGHFTATVFGPLTLTGAAGPGSPDTLTPMTVINGWGGSSAATTTGAGFEVVNVGAIYETDAQLRTRDALSIASPTQGMVDGIKAALLKVQGVYHTQVFEMVGESPDNVGDAFSTWPGRGSGNLTSPINGIWCIVDGGVAQDVAAAIYPRVGQGVQTVGTTEILAPVGGDSQGQYHDIFFSYAGLTPIYLGLAIVGAVTDDPITSSRVAAFLTTWQQNNCTIGALLSWVQVLNAIKDGCGLDIRAFGQALTPITGPSSGFVPLDISSAAIGKANLPTFQTANIHIVAA
jgi:hypothetical protein